MRKNCLDYEKWFEESDQDLGLADLGLNSNKAEYARTSGSCIYNAVEKAIKAVIINKTKKLPEKIHDLEKLFSDMPDPIKNSISPEERKFISELSQYFIPLRYPQENSISIKLEKVKEWHKLATSIVQKLKDNC